MAVLEEVLKKIDGPVLIGADKGSAYMICGENVDLGGLDEMVYGWHLQRIKYSKYHLNRLMHMNPIEDPEKEEKRKRHIKLDRQRIKLEKQFLANYIPVHQREVLMTFQRLSGDGTAVIIEGDEAGQYWSVKEYEEEKYGKRN